MEDNVHKNKLLKEKLETYLDQSKSAVVDIFKRNS